MLGLLNFATAAVFALLPFALVYSVANDEIDCRGEATEKTPFMYVRRLLAVTVVLWVPYVFAAVCWAETLLFANGQPLVARLSMYLLWSLPLAWGLTLAMILEVGFALSLLLVPVAYVIGLLIVGALGWMVGLKFLVH